MQSAVKKFGNSAGVVIPKPLLTEIGAKVGDDIDIGVQDGRIVIELVAKIDPREGWAEDAAALMAAGDYEIVLGDFPNDFDDEEWVW
ncbi:MAG: AbrB/MazE/SpoVT family DNA-binding domain-containing protein [Candidatus Devosia phytovorans]|uniref:AbrB/MazE/SpoVT family DNA-binding domain-containing protein n=1 Tax=Candidatus Devosia phytovorans TaxID=3121372 RepID=A0AAJ5VRP5_9HYPH|nr:AbrB/MazE/SpoVT family DNA-binding domain-containing protein [Devosia sp.]WEK03553.1 MAG: AbrB/MazE/SpoVT family DNA-binding domain-containing protein [Devosia sp.]